MSREYEFLRECEYFYVLTINGDFPAGRPFGAVMEHEDKLYIATHDGNKVHEQIRNNGNIQLLAKKEGTREWARISGRATECMNMDIRQKMLDECSNVAKHYPTAEYEHYILFQIEVTDSEFK